MQTAEFDLDALLRTPAALQNAVKQIPCQMLRPYHNHKFEMYSGERLEDMVESIKANGIICPLIVQPYNFGYEILIGHNRWNAAKIAGLETVPAVIKEGLSPEEMETIVIESNVIQRGFDNLKISEQAAVIAQRHSEMFSQGKRNDIIRELKKLDGESDNTSSQIDTMSESGDTKQKIAQNYGMSRSSVARLLRIDKLVNSLKNTVDNGVIAVNAAIHISYLSEETQNLIAELTDEESDDPYRIDIKKARLLRASADENGNVGNADIIRILDGRKDNANKGHSVKISGEVFRRFFGENVKKKEITETVEKALEMYFSGAGRKEED